MTKYKLTLLIMCTVLMQNIFGSTATYPKNVQILIQAYPDESFAYTEEEEGTFLGVNGTKILFEPKDGCTRANPSSLQDPPLCAIFQDTYPLGAGGRYPKDGFDPGRVRNQKFLMEAYGHNKDVVLQRSEEILAWDKALPFSIKNGASKSLKNVIKKLEIALQKNPKLSSYILPIDDTFTWRYILNSPKLSPHSFSIAIDLNVEKGIYWLWEYKNKSELLEKTRVDYPQEIVDIFESEGFIWGGKWSAYDFMHFEYRPEMLLHAKQNE